MRRSLISFAPLALLAGCVGDVPGDDDPQQEAQGSGSSDDTVGSISYVDPINPVSDPVLARLGKLLAGNARYQLKVWLPSMGYDAPGDRFAVPSDESGIRPITATAEALAIVLATKAYDEAAIGVPRAEAVRITTRLIRSLAAGHVANGGHWGDGWQTALWTANTGLAAWLVWNDLDTATRLMVHAIVIHEANRFISYAVPYHRDKIGRELTPGDTKAEENSWNSRVVSLALAMLPNHANARAWREKKIELQLSSYANIDDVSDPTPVHGRPMCRWLGGFNSISNGYLNNHNRLHPGYMRTPHHAADAVHHMLVDRAVDKAALVNLDRTYAALVDVKFGSPPQLAPGGSAYRVGSPEVYFPHGDDWGGNGYAPFVLHDIQADALSFDSAASSPATTWIEPRIIRVEQQMARFTDGRVYAAGEAVSLMAEQDAFEKTAEAYLTRTLSLQRTLKVSDVDLGGAPGCPAIPRDLAFCPSDTVTRGQLATLMMRMKYGGEFVPRPSTGMFTDVAPGSGAAGMIEQLARDGITSGCAAGKFCPGDALSRAQAATLLVRYRYGATYQAPPAQGVFGDVPANALHAANIEQLYRDGIIAGCQPGMYCPSDSLTRAQLATLLVRATRGAGYTPAAATGIFSDVPATSTHARAIEYLYDQGITLGCK